MDGYVEKKIRGTPGMEANFRKKVCANIFRYGRIYGVCFFAAYHTSSRAFTLSVNYEGKEIRIADDGFMWLQQFPTNKHHSVTTMFDANGNIVQWYIDICLENGHSASGPWMDDLFLDIILLPSGDIIEKDATELEEALTSGVVNKDLYNLAWNEARTIKGMLLSGSFDLVNLSNKHKNSLLNELR